MMACSILSMCLQLNMLSQGYNFHTIFALGSRSQLILKYFTNLVSTHEIHKSLSAIQAAIQGDSYSTF